MSMFAAILGLPAGDTRLLTGVERDDDGLRIYVGPRWQGIHAHAPAGENPQLDHMADHGFQPHIFIDVPDDALCDCPSEAAS